MSFGEKQGHLHAHSWQVQIEAHVPSEKEELIAFAKVFDQVKKTMVLYENKVLNEEYPFQRIQPTTENISLYFYNLLEDALAEVGLGLGKVTVWEPPTRGIEVTNRYRAFDRILSAEGLKNSNFIEFEPILNPEICGYFLSRKVLLSCLYFYRRFFLGCFGSVMLGYGNR